MNVFEKIIEKLEEMKMNYFLTIANTGDKKSDAIYESVGNTIDKSIEIINEVAEKHNNGWIPISSGKRPKDNQFILFTVKLERGGNLETFYDTKYGFYEFYDEGLGRFVISDGSVNTIPFGEVIAWQPLPEPYKPKGEKHG